MLDSEKTPSTSERKITIIKNGPYRVHGKVPLVQKTQVVSEYGEPLTWKKDRDIEIDADRYLLCRCGKSEKMPFCDNQHLIIDFDGTEQAKTDGTSDYQITFRGGTRLIVKKDLELCMNSGFCCLKNKDISQLVATSSDTGVRSLAIAMVERCPSGSLTFKIEPGEEDIEPDYPQQIADTIEITSDGPIPGPLWVTGWIQIERSDGQEFVARNRVTLCNCGLSSNKPLCDGTHRSAGQQLVREEKAAKE